MFKDNLKQIRLAHKLTQKELAAKLYLSPQRYNYYETGRNEPDYATLKIIANYFNVSIDALLDDDPYKWQLQPSSNSQIIDSNESQLLVAFRQLDDEKKQQAIRVVRSL